MRNDRRGGDIRLAELELGATRGSRGGHQAGTGGEQDVTVGKLVQGWAVERAGPREPLLGTREVVEGIQVVPGRVASGDGRGGRRQRLPLDGETLRASGPGAR